ncbi:hypothetical protein C9374_003025 [Naegleria lovaniensis]|uniref:F-box domain-containing protein n=1 Tax=Naegleria lovaniensis TaxID=51637 RepID=A0AA88GPE1_NAELO|nr:uncharacterized protein C9374_003025 [Naegleria lovaniensis]KAG2385876.1 hypothetical protein C9374_003025 [Naegleria lovaniensis]
MSSILELPSEIYHHIFSYLDYVKDICRDPYLSYLPVQKDEIDHLLRTPCFVDFEKELKALSELQPLSMTCSTFCKMIASYKPLSLMIRFSCHNLENCIRQRPVKRGFECETSYTMKLYVSRWYDFSIVEPTKQEFRILNISKWRNYLEKFINRRKACFRNIEYVGVFSDVGKNYCSSISIQPIQFPFSLFPKLKYMTLHLVGACIYAREIVPDHVIMNYVTSSTTFGNPPQVPLNPTDFGAFEYSQRNKSIHETIFSVVNKFPKQYLRVELYILILLKISKFEAARSLIDNFTIDEDYFSYAWNFSLAESFQNHDKDRFRATISLLARIKQKFKGIVIKRLCINSMEQLKIVEEYGVLDQRDIMPNITLHFLTYISNNQETELLKSLIDKYGVYIGRYGCSLLYTLSDFMINFVKTNVKGYDFIRNVIVTEQDQQHDEKSMIEKFRVPFHMQNISLNPTYHTMFKYLEIDPYVTDMYGNNLLHYGCFFRYLSKYKGTSVLGLSEDIVSKLLNVPNNFGITPLMIDSLRFTYISFRHDEISFTLKYHREYPCLYLRNQLEQCHGLIWTPSRIQIMWSDSVPKSVVSQTYPIFTQEMRMESIGAITRAAYTHFEKRVI